jgi:hypothetical protein
MVRAVAGATTTVERGATDGVVFGVGGWVLVCSGGAVAVAEGEGLGGSSLVEQAVTIRSAVIARVMSGAECVASQWRICCAVKLLIMPASATSSNSSQ